jgi:hypothetical protein
MELFLSTRIILITILPDCACGKEIRNCMKKIVLIAATLGLLVAFSTGCVWFYIYNHGLSETGGAHLFARISSYVWPTSIVMMDANRADFGTILLFLTSSIMNAFIYGIVAFCTCFVWRRLFGAVST